MANNKKSKPKKKNKTKIEKIDKKSKPEIEKKEKKIKEKPDKTIKKHELKKIKQVRAEMSNLIKNYNVELKLNKKNKIDLTEEETIERTQKFDYELQFLQKELDHTELEYIKNFNSFSFKIKKWFFGIGKEFKRIHWLNVNGTFYNLLIVIIFIVVLSLLFFGIASLAQLLNSL